MPELPELENYRILLTKKIGGHSIDRVDVWREKTINVPPEMFRREVAGRRIERIERRAKHLIFRLNSGKALLLHLMLSGWMFYGQERHKPERSAQVALHFGAESLYFISLRLGYLHLLEPDELERTLNHLGPEPLTPEFTPELCAGLIRQRRSRLKTALVDQSFISGIGNCYSDEICFAAGLLPTRLCSDLRDREIGRLYEAIRTVLSEAVRCGGYMAHPLYIGDERTGGFDERCKVYDRGGEPCVRCGHPIVFQKVSSRKCFYCANCQQ